MGLKDKMNAALERANAGRAAKLAAKSDVAYNQENYKKSAKLAIKSKKVGLRNEKREAINETKYAGKPKKVKTINDAMGISEGPRREFSMLEPKIMKKYK